MEGGVHEATLGFLSSFKGPFPRRTHLSSSLCHAAFPAHPFLSKQRGLFFCCCKQPKNLFSYRCCHLPYFVKHSQYYAHWLIHFFFFFFSWATFFFSLRAKKKRRKKSVRNYKPPAPQRSVLQGNMCQLYSDHHFGPRRSYLMAACIKTIKPCPPPPPPTHPPPPQQSFADVLGEI